MASDDTQHIWPIDGIKELDLQTVEEKSSEILGIKDSWQRLRDQLDENQVNQFTERMQREWALETGIIERVYELSRGVTTTLIEQGFDESTLSHLPNKSNIVALLRDQKDVIEDCYKRVQEDNAIISTHYIKSIHAKLMEHQSDCGAIDQFGHTVRVEPEKGKWKTMPNNPERDSRLFHYCPTEQTESEMNRLLHIYSAQLRKEVPIELRVAWFHHRFSQIHPFQDGNGRVARTLCSLILIKERLFPLLVTEADRTVYIDSLEQADQGNINPLVDLIVKLQRTRWHVASWMARSLNGNPSLVSHSKSVRHSQLAELKEDAEKHARKSAVKLHDGIERHIEKIRMHLKRELGKFSTELQDSLQSLNTRIKKNMDVRMSQDKDSYYYERDVRYNAKHYFKYFADMAVHRSWVALRMNGETKIKLVFACHGIGRPFAGSLIVAPFIKLEFHHEDDGSKPSIVEPLAKEGFIFYHAEATEDMIKRFESWLDEVIEHTIYVLRQNLF